MTANAPPAPPSPATSHRRRRLHRLALGTAILCVLLICAHLAWYAVAKADLAEAWTVAEAAGLPRDPALVIPPPCPDADNAALRYERAYGYLLAPGKGYVPGRSAGTLDQRITVLLERLEREPERERIIATESENVLALLDHEDFRRTWAVLAEGAHLPRCRFDNAYDGFVPGILRPQIGLMQTLSRLGSLRARLLAARGRTTEATALFADVLAMLNHYREEPFLISSFFSMKMEAVVLDDLRVTLGQGQVGGADLGRMRQTLDAEARIAQRSQVLHGEFAFMGIPAFNLQRTWGTDPHSFTMSYSGLFGNRPFWSTLFSDNMVSFLREEDFSRRILMWSYDSWLGAPLLAGDEAAYLRGYADGYVRFQWSGDGRVTLPPVSRWHPLTGMLLPPTFEYSWKAFDLGRRRAATARLALDAAMGGTPVATTDVTVERTPEGGWLIIGQGLDPQSTNSRQRELARMSWRIPPHR